MVLFTKSELKTPDNHHWNKQISLMEVMPSDDTDNKYNSTGVLTFPKSIKTCTLNTRKLFFSEKPPQHSEHCCIISLKTPNKHK